MWVSPYPSFFLCWTALESGGCLAPSCNGICRLSPRGHHTEPGPHQQHLKAVTVPSMVLFKTKATILALHPCGKSQPGKAARNEQRAPQRKRQFARVHENDLKKSFMVWWHLIWGQSPWAGYTLVNSLCPVSDVHKKSGISTTLNSYKFRAALLQKRKGWVLGSDLSSLVTLIEGPGPRKVSSTESMLYK